jgi:alpha-L-fucosidase 2
MPARDPTSFSLYGSNDGGSVFVPIVRNAPIPPFKARNDKQLVAFANTTAYTTYKLIFPTVAGGPDFQVAEAELLGVSLGHHLHVAPVSPPGKLSIWFDHPGSSPLTEGLPIGNGRLGALVLGGTASERLPFNEISLWTGDENPSGNYDTMGSFQAFGDVMISLPSTIAPTRYRRLLDLSTSTAHVDYDSAGTSFHREYFVSHPDQVIVEQLTASKPGSYTGSIALTDAHKGTISVSGHLITSHGTLSNGEMYEAEVEILHLGGTMSATDTGITFAGCDSLTVVLGAGTDYVMDYARHYKGNDPHVAATVAAAASKSFAALEADHVRDYKALFDRVTADFGKSASDRTALPTDQRKRLDKQGDDPEQEALQFQFGRYLAISSSRPGSLPINLQGLWNDTNNPPWHGDYHTDVNIQMCYWPEEPTNLSECTQPLIDYVASQIPAWRIETANDPTWKLASGPVRGWDVRTSLNINGGMGWNWIKGDGAWLARNLWEHYAFTGDKKYLSGFLYPVLKDETEFWEDHLKTLPNGTLVVPKDWSPEHGPTEDGISFDQELVWDLFTNYMKASDTLGIDSDYRAKVSALRSKLALPKIGKWGQLQEWMEDIDDPNEHHRHTSHLFAVYPGDQINLVDTPDLAKAAETSLIHRGQEGDSNAEWALAWRTSLWARLHEPERAHNLVAMFESQESFPNMLGDLGPMQMDGDFGITAGIAEMLLQSQAGDIELLPALPSGWATGDVTGLKARGNYTVDESWANGKLIKATITPASTGPITVRYAGKTTALTLTAGKPVVIGPSLSRFK